MSSIKYDGSYLKDLRPADILYHFPLEPTLTHGKYTWSEFDIRESPGKGLGVYIKDCPRGFLIPYGGNFISVDEYNSRVESKRGIYHQNINYLYEVTIKEEETSEDYLQVGYYDSNPTNQHPANIWPAAFVNEIAEERKVHLTRKRAITQANPNQELYNSRFVLVDVKNYKIPHYMKNLGIISDHQYQVFLEVMVEVVSLPNQNSRRRPERLVVAEKRFTGPIELFASYRKSYYRCRSMTYTPIPENLNTRVKGNR